MNRNIIVLLVVCFSHIASARDFSMDTISFLALGDSYTIGQSVDSSLRWPVQLIDSLRTDGKVINDFKVRATTGWTTTSLLSSLSSDLIKNSFNVVSLLIGVNNFFQGRPEHLYIQEFQQLLDSAESYCSVGKNGVFMVSIPDYGFSPFGQNNQTQISKSTDRYNFIGDSIATANGIEFINITDLSRKWTNDPTLVASDGLHPSGKQYSSWVNRILANDVQGNSAIGKINLNGLPAVRLAKSIWKFTQAVELHIYNWNGQLIHHQSVVKNQVVDLTKVKGDLMNVLSKNQRWSVKL